MNACAQSASDYVKMVEDRWWTGGGRQANSRSLI